MTATTRITVSLPTDMALRLDAVARSEDRSASAIVRRALRVVLPNLVTAGDAAGGCGGFSCPTVAGVSQGSKVSAVSPIEGGWESGPLTSRLPAGAPFSAFSQVHAASASPEAGGGPEACHPVLSAGNGPPPSGHLYMQHYEQAAERQREVDAERAASARQQTEATNRQIAESINRLSKDHSK